MRKIIFIIMVLVAVSLPAWATVDLEVGNGVVVETSGNVTVEIDGELTETGTGYFKGTISSGARTGMTSFAGMTLSAGMDGSITRTTGTAYSKANGEGANLKRYYEINNTGSSAVVADMSCTIVSSGDNDEQNGLAGPYFIYEYVSDWTGCGDGCDDTPVTASSVSIPTGTSDWVLSEGIRIDMKIFLEGCYDASGDSMYTTLAPENSDYIPTTSPHSEDPRTVSSVPNGVTDWVLVEVRSTIDGSAVGYRSCFLKNDGTLVCDDATNGFIGVKVKPGDYFLVVRHRNHLAIETPAAETGLTWGVTPTQYNFTTALAKFKGTDAALLETGVYGMYCGDANYDGFVTATDKNGTWRPQNGTNGYKEGDLNLDGYVTALDKNGVWRPNNGKGSQVQ